MTSARDIIEMTKKPDGTVTVKKTHQDDDGQGGSEGQNVGYRPPSAQAGTVVPTTESLTGDTGGYSMEEFLPFLAGAGGLSFEQEMELQALRNAGSASVASISSGISQAIANMQEAAETGRFVYGTEAEARTAAQTFSENIKAALANMLSEQGYSTPALALAKGPESARLALIEALRSGSLMPTMARQQMLAQAAAHPTDVMGLLALTAGQDIGAFSPEEKELRERLSFNLPKVIGEGREARADLLGSLEGMESMTFQDLLDRLLPLVEPAVAPAMGGGFGGGGGYAPPPAASSTAAAPVNQFLPVPGDPTYELGGTIPRVDFGTSGTMGGRVTAPLNTLDGVNQATEIFLEAPKQGRTTWHVGMVTTNMRKLNTSDFFSYRRGFNDLAGNVMQQFQGSSAAYMGGGYSSDPKEFFTKLSQKGPTGELKRLGELWLAVEKEYRERISEDIAEQHRTQRPGRQAEGGAHYDPGYFIIGEGKKDEGLKAGTAEYAYLPPGSIIAPIPPGEAPTMDNARRAIMAMVMKGNPSQPQRAQAGAITAEEDVIAETSEALATLFGKGGIMSDILKGRRPIAGTLGGFKLSGLSDYSDVLSKIDPGLRKRLFGVKATQFPYQSFLNMTPEMREAVTGVLGPVYGDPAILSAVMGLHEMLRGKAFAGSPRISLVR
jgi:hypothetical protein